MQEKRLLDFVLRPQITTADWVGETGKQRLEQFEVDVINRMSEPPWNNSYAKDNNMTVK